MRTFAEKLAERDEDQWENEGGVVPPPHSIGLGMTFVLWVFYVWCLFLIVQGLGLISLSDFTG